MIKNKLSLSVGARYDRINVNGEATLNPIYEITNGVVNYSPSGQKVIWNKTDANDNSYSGNIGLKYSTNFNLDFTLSLGLSFRSPSLEERFQYIDQGSFVRIGNPNLESERCRSADFGIRYYSSKLKIISSIFFNYFNNLVAEVPGTFGGRNAFIKTNIGEARIYGFDFQADYNFYNDCIVYTNASYVKGDDLTVDGNLPQIPPLNGDIGIKFNLFGKLQSDFSATIFAAQNSVAANEMKTPGYAVFNLLINIRTIKLSSLDVRLYAGIENILDKNYRNHLSTTRGEIDIEPGRNFFVNLVADF
jgi:hemoglobin/transferrin/lactoferrin receptor protein